MYRLSFLLLGLKSDHPKASSLLSGGGVLGVVGIRKEKERELSLKHTQREKGPELIQRLSKSKGKGLLLPLEISTPGGNGHTLPQCSASFHAFIPGRFAKHLL